MSPTVQRKLCERLAAETQPDPRAAEVRRHMDRVKAQLVAELQPEWDRAIIEGVVARERETA